jgi:signal transduction histidine kinase/CheY-like chemotaxis protein
VRLDAEFAGAPGDFSARFRYSEPLLAGLSPVFYETRLAGAPWSVPSPGAMREFSALARGSYDFEVRAVDRWGRAGPVASRAFAVPAPWWMTWPALAAAAAALVLAFAGILRRRTSRLARRNAELETLVADRTRELSEANDAKAEFLESISHEIRNPLSGVIGLAGMLRESPLRGPELELTRSLHACANALRRVFDDVLTFTRLEHGQLAVESRPFDLRELVQEVAALYSLLARQKAAEIRVEFQGDVPEAGRRFSGDADKIKTILGNFVANALRYAPGAPVEIRAEAANCDDFGADVTLFVTDRGPGIAPGEQAAIFRKFVRGEQARRGREPGAGLGLATCKALAGLMGGHVAVESPAADFAGSPRKAPGGPGSTFFLRITLPWAEEAQEASGADPGIVPVSEAGPAPQREGPREALVVEDQPYNRMVLRRLLDKMGYAVTEADCGEDALRALGGGLPDLAFVDWELPGISGADFVARLRAMPGGAAPIILVTTAHDRVGGEAARHAIDGVMTKPLDRETIARGIDAALVRRGRPGLFKGARLDTSVFSLVAYDDPGHAAEAASLYGRILDQEMEALEAEAAAGRWESAAKVAHRLKAHAGLVDATGLRDAAESVQRDIVAADGARGAMIDAVRREAAALRRRLESLSAAG